MHDTGPPWIATPSMLDSFIPFYMPVYPGALSFHTLSQVAYFSENTQARNVNPKKVKLVCS